MGLTIALNSASAGCTWQSDSCFVGSTQVRTPSGARAIRDLRVGDEVLACDVATGKLLTVRVREVHTAQVSKVYRVARSRGAVGGVTAAHPIFEAGLHRFVRLDELAAGSRLLTLDGALETDLRPDVIETIEAVDVNDTVTVFNLTVDAPSTYFADGVLVHNKDPYVPDDSSPDTGIVPDAAADTTTPDSGSPRDSADAVDGGDASDETDGDTAD